MTRPRPETLAVRNPGVDRALGRLISLASMILIAAEFARFAGSAGAFSPAWTGAGITMVLLSVVSAAGASRLPEPALRMLWAGFVVLLVVLELTVFAAYRGTDPDALFPWVWRFESVAVCYLVLLAPPIVALAFPLVAGLLPALSGLLVLGRIPDTVAAQTPLHLGNVVFAVLFLAMRSRLSALSRAEEAARAEEARRAALDALAEQQERFTRVVHDELLSVFSAALHVSGDTPPVLRSGAGLALDRLRGTLVAPDDGATTAGPDARRMIVATVRDVLPTVRIREAGDDAAVPTHAAEAVRSALAEAARNVARHASGAPAFLSVDTSGGRIDASLTDEGPGFAPEDVPSERLGVRRSILGRMQQLPGGSGRIESSSSGTRVILAWHP